ncbi:ABC transporter permease [Candidatus Saccharibacteria bacterium]|jgi:ABC-2 type transport system permease protein|nr:MAG: ABC transporter permease [Candidatus Saccharibacteria bacterium]
MLGIFKKRSRALLGAMLITDFKIRYQGSALGYLWSLVRPLSLFVILYIVFAKFFKVGDNIPHFGSYLLLGVMLWNFFAEATGNALSSLVDRADLIRKVMVPRYTVILVAVLSSAINLLINLVVVGVIISFAGIDPSPWAIVLVPLLILELVGISLAFGFILSILYVRFRDIKYIWELLLQVAFYATPIIYPISKIPQKYHALISLNPIAQIIQDMRDVLVTNHTLTSWEILGKAKASLCIIAPVLLGVFAYLYFKRNIGKIAEDL